MDHHPTLGRESVFIQASSGGNKDPRFFYSSAYSTEYNTDLITKLPSIYKPPKKPLATNSYFRQRQPTGFVENEIAFISADWMADPFKSE
jgi:hypothetical protein